MEQSKNANKMVIFRLESVMPNIHSIPFIFKYIHLIWPSASDYAYDCNTSYPMTDTPFMQEGDVWKCAISV